jgi:hypothetical protein
MKEDVPQPKEEVPFTASVQRYESVYVPYCVIPPYIGILN